MRKSVIVLLFIAACAAVYWFAIAQPGALKTLTGLFNGSAKVQKPRSEPEPTVTATLAQRHNVPVTVSALGTAQGANTVQIRVQVDGTLESVKFTEGQIVKRGDVLAQIDPRLYKAALEQAKAKLAQDQAQLVSDQKDLERAQELGERNFTSKQTIDQRRAAVDKNKALIDSDKAAIDSAQTQLNYTTITAPFTGRIGLRAVDPGNIVRASDATAIATLVQHQPVFVVFSLPENQLGPVRKAMQGGVVPVVAHDQDSNQPIATGELRVIDNQIDATTGTVRMKAEFDNNDGALWPGQFVPVTVRIVVRNDVVALPNAAIQRGPKGLYVWVVNGGGKAQMAPVETGPVQGDLTIIESGINSGDRVVVAGQYRLRPDVPVRIEEPKVSSRDGAGTQR